MRKLTRFLFFALLTISLHAQTTSTYRTEVIDGNNGFSNTLEKFNTTRTQISAFVTWDKDNIYIAYSGSTPNGPLTDNDRAIHVYIDIDPQLVPTQGTGSTSGDAWRWFPTLPFTANYHYVFKTVNNEEVKRKHSSGSWADFGFVTQNYKNTATGYWELRIARSGIENPSQINVVAYIEEDFTGGTITGGLPSNLFTDNTSQGPITFNSTFLNVHFLDKMAPNAPFHLGNNGWSLKLKAVSGSVLDTTAMAGMFANATDGYDTGIDLPKAPPAPSNFIDVYFPRTGWGSALGPNYERDFKLRTDLSATTSTWTFTVNSDISGNIILSAASFSDVPSAYAISLKDLSTNTVTDLRTGNYTYNNLPSEATSRNFELKIGVTLSNPTISLSHTTYNFGILKTDKDSSFTLTISNSGDQALHLSRFSLTGDFYSIAGDTVTILPKNASTTRTIKFAPRAAGTFTGRLIIASNDPSSPSDTVSLTGIGQSLSPNISVWVDTLKFGSVVAGTSSNLGFYAANTGDTALTVSNVVATGTGFSYSGSTGFTVAINDSSQITVRFSPATTGNFTGTITITSNDPDTPTKTVQLSGKGTTSSASKIYSAGWNLMSIPLNPVSNLAPDVLAGIPSYLLYKYASGTYQNSTTIDPAFGYWLGIETDDTVNLTGIQLLTDQTKALAGGWNLIASPFAGGSSKSNLRITRNDTTWTIDQAAAAGLVQVPVYKYVTATKQYEMVPTLNAWDGHWFFTLASDLSVKYIYALSDASEPKEIPEIETTPSNWFVDILSEMNGVQDKYLAFGTNEAATDGFDNSFDYVKAPMSPAATAIESYFLQTGWSNFATRFASNIQAPLMNGVNKSWSFKVYAKSAGSFKISWLDILNRIPQEIRNAYTFTLRGPGISSGINMLTQTVYEFNVTTGGTYSFVINSSPVGVEEELMNLSFKLGQNYPNPFNPSTTINYAIKETGLVTLKIYDVLGNEVVTLVNDVKQPGQYEVKFEASNLPSGTYIYKLVQGKNSEIKKLMLLK
ncbi:MAG: choice-of-anchor D domain-containing protein [Ignavibacteriales bacterium]|nr:choice-of-anchor D domain-containing protein [Ignavibacteriales bacterium]